jgi:hypothetical protein
MQQNEWRAQWKGNGKNTAKVDGLPVLRAGREGAWLRQLAAHFLEDSHAVSYRFALVIQQVISQRGRSQSMQ